MPPLPEPVTLARHAMATRFEIVLYGENPVALRAAGEEALNEIERLEDLLSLYRTATEIAHVNARAGTESVRISVPVFRLLRHALQLSEETGGAFDITVGPLMRCWGFMAEAGRVPSDEELADARDKVGWEGVILNDSDFTVRFARPGMMIDLGAIGKGYAIDCAVELLREAGVASAILHGGTSSIYAIGHPPAANGWTVAVRSPESASAEETPLSLPTFLLRDGALSVSAVWGRSFQTSDGQFGHVIDPRSGRPVRGVVLAAVALPSTTETDALSTALLTLGTSGLSLLQQLRPAVESLVVESKNGKRGVLSLKTPL